MSQLPLLYFLEWAVGAILILGIITQLLIPAVQGRPLFPYFRKPRHLQDELGEVEEEAEAVGLEGELQRRQRELAKERRRLGR